jgi:hypothetical protein
MKTMLAVALCCAIFAAAAVAQTPKNQTTIYGEVVDLVNFIANNMKADTPDRKALAESNAKGGNPLGILERGTGRLYVVTLTQGGTGANATLTPYLGLKIFAQGRVLQKGGVRLFVLSDIGKSVK